MQLLQVEDKVAEQNQKNKTEQNTEESSESKAKVGENEADPVIPNNKMELKYKYREGGSILFDYCLLASRNKMIFFLRQGWTKSSMK